jgi:hypothetical protein
MDTAPQIGEMIARATHAMLAFMNRHPSTVWAEDWTEGNFLNRKDGKTGMVSNDQVFFPISPIFLFK